MGYSSSAHFIAGVKIDADTIVERKKRRVCSHPETDAKFCPECGKPMWEDVSIDVHDYISDIDEDMIHYGDAERHEVIVGVEMKKADSDGHIVFIDLNLLEGEIPEGREEVMDKMIELGGKPGMWLVFKESC